MGQWRGVVTAVLALLAAWLVFGVLVFLLVGQERGGGEAMADDAGTDAEAEAQAAAAAMVELAQS